MADDHTSATGAANANHARTQEPGGQESTDGAEPRRVDGDPPEQDWGEVESAEETFSSNSRRGEPILGQGGKTRRANKDIVSRRG